MSFYRGAYYGQCWQIDTINESLVALAQQSARRRDKEAKRRRRLEFRKGQALRPGVDTPLWNALAAAVKAQLRQPVIFDGRNLYEPALMRELGIEHYGTGRGGSPPAAA